MKNANFLRSWKEIAAYLGVDQRTCLRWEKSLGLPVHRAEGVTKGSVFAYKEEIDRWILEGSVSNGRPGPNGKTGVGGRAVPPRPDFDADSDMVSAYFMRRVLLTRRTRRFLLILHLLLAAAIGTGFFLLQAKPMSRVPHDFRVEGQDLVVLNPRGREIWRKDTGLGDLAGQAFYKSRVQTRRLDDQARTVLPLIAFKDVDLDGGQEVLFATKTLGEKNERELICFDSRGRERWRFKAGGALVFGGRIFPADYRLAGFDLRDIDQNGKLEILLYALQKPDWPCQFAVLDCDGKILGEYWNAGPWTDFQVIDLNGDGRDEIIGAGVNHEYGTGFLVVLDPRDISGMSPQLRAQYTCPGLKRGSEKYYILLPRVPFLRPEEPVESVKTVYLHEDKEISVLLELSGLYAQFNSALEFLRFSPSYLFERQVNLAAAAKKIAGPLPPDFLESLGKQVLYFDGEAKKWTPSPAMSNKW